MVSHPKEGEIILTDSYEAFGTHYLTAIMPARVRKPKDKPSVEGTVGKIATAVIARLRNETFYSFAALKKAVLEKLDEFNHHPFTEAGIQPLRGLGTGRGRLSPEPAGYAI